MSQLLELAGSLRETSQAIAAHEAAIALDPSPSLTASLRSLTKRLGRLEAEFAALAADRGVDVCRYRFFAEYVNPTVRPVCAALLNFQHLYTLAYDAIKNGAKHVTRVSEDTLEQSTFGFGYSYSGSLGIALTFNNRKIDLFESAMDEAMKGLFALIQATSPGDVAAQGRILGTSTVRAAHVWAKSHIEFGLGADISWVKGEAIKDRLVMDANAIGAFVDILNNTSESTSKTFDVDGTFSGGEYAKHQFHFIADDGTDYKGTYTDAISEANPVQFPMRYRATIKRTTKTFYTSERTDAVTDFLEKLTPVHPITPRPSL